MRITSETEILDTLRAVLHEALRVPVTRIEPHARIFDDLGAESIDILDIRFRIEEAFGFHIPEGDIIRSIDPSQPLEQLRQRFTVGAIVTYVSDRLAGEA